MEQIIVDSCTIILLAKATVLETFVENYYVYITQAIYDEVMMGKVKKRYDALLFEKLYHQGKVTIIDYKKRIMVKLKYDFNMDNGEASILAVAIDKKEFALATDSKQARKCAVLYSLPMFSSFSIITHLYKSKKITLKKALGSISVLKKEGWFNHYLIEKIKEDLQHD
ncbi:hypothetical protein HYY69_04530 [Candidatus Woesearchaeota archaeon]|nr:hypothetical protein [Candidatus Woesearchaeota archaeon]